MPGAFGADLAFALSTIAGRRFALAAFDDEPIERFVAPLDRSTSRSARGLVQGSC